jgi:hypothetical protein
MASRGHKPNELFIIVDAASQVARLTTKLISQLPAWLSWLKKEVGADLGDLSFGTLSGRTKFRTAGVLESSHIGAGRNSTRIG